MTEGSFLMQVRPAIVAESKWVGSPPEDFDSAT